MIRAGAKSTGKLSSTNIPVPGISRTIVTSFTVLLTSVALFFFGGEVIHDFALAMILGVIVGTYSSIFVASPIVLLWKGKKTFAKK